MRVADELTDFPVAGFRARRWLRFERDFQAWLDTPDGRFARWCAAERGSVLSHADHTTRFRGDPRGLERRQA
jgi:hypothetical protein